MGSKGNKNGKVFLLFHKSHFAQIYSQLIFERFKKSNTISLTLDSNSLEKVKSKGYDFITPSCALKEDARASVFNVLSNEIDTWGRVSIEKKQCLQDFLANPDFDLWEIVKNPLAIKLFDKLYFVELLRNILLELSPDILVVPLFPRKVALDHLTEINRKTIISLADTLGIKVISRSFLVSSLFYFPYLSTRIILKIFQFFCGKNRISGAIQKILIRKSKTAPKTDIGPIKGKIIIFGDFPNLTFREIIPVLTRLQDRGFNCKLAISKDNFIKHSTLRKVDVIFVDNFAKCLDDGMLSSVYRGYQKKWSILISENKLKALFVYRGISLLSNEYQEIAYFLHPKAIKNTYKYSLITRLILQGEKPDCLIFPDTQNVVGRISAQAALGNSIPYLCLPEAADQLYENTFLFDIQKDSRYAIAGQGVFDKTSRGRAILPKEHALITGLARWDQYHQFSPAYDREYIYNKLNIDKKHKIFVFTLQSGLLDNKKVISSLVMAMKLFPDKHLIIRPHPDDTGYAAFILKHYKQTNVRLSKDFDFASIASISEIVFTVYSLTGFEAILLDKPLITINFSLYPDCMPYARYGAALGVYQEEDLIPTINKALFDSLAGERLREGRKNILKDYAYNLDGGATKRIVNLVEEFIIK